ncbi:hypothetical protein JCM3765_007696 [Sporobolomyces pararoseus]
MVVVSLSPTCRKLLIDLGAREVITYLLKRLENNTPELESTIEREYENTTNYDNLKYENEKEVLKKQEKKEEEDSKMSDLILSESEEEEELLVSPTLSRSSSLDSGYSSQSTSSPLEGEEGFDLEEEEEEEGMEIDDEDSQETSSSEENDEEEDYLTFPRLPSDDSITTTDFTPYYYFKLSLLDSFISQHSRNLIAEDELSLRQFALQVVEDEEPMEKETIEKRKKLLKGLRKDLQVCNDDSWKESRQRFLRVLQEYFFERLPTTTTSKGRREEEEEFGSNFINLSSLRRPELYRHSTTRTHYSSCYLYNRGDGRLKIGGNLRKEVLISQAFLRINQDFKKDFQDNDEKGCCCGNPVPTSIMLEQLNQEEEEEEEVVRGRKRQWSELEEFESDETYFNQLPIF